MAADTIIHDAWLETLDADAGANSVAITDGRIRRIGRPDELRDLVGPGTEVLDAQGMTLLPAFTDSHTHFKRASVLMAYFIDFDAVLPKSIADVLAVVEQQVAAAAPGAWVQGDSLNYQRLAERRFPTRHELDAVSGSVPVILRGVGRHLLAANSAALRHAGIDATTPDPAGGRLERDAAGEPTGVLHEQAQLRLDANAPDTVVPPVSREQRLDALRRGVNGLHRAGIAAVHEIPREPEQVADWLELREAGDLQLRVRFYIRGLAARTKLEYLLGLGLRGGFGDDMVRIGGVKFSLDGSALLRNAMVFEPYPSEPDNLGIERLDPQELAEAMRLAHDAGFQIAVHAIGQRAVDQTLRHFEALAAHDPAVPTRRHRIEHAYLPEPGGQLERMRALGIVLSTQPSFIEAIGDGWAAVFGDDELRGCVPIATALAMGIHVQINSDFPCSLLDPFVGIAAAVNRTTREGRVLGIEEAVDTREALRMMTWAPAYTAFEEAWRGRLEEGYAADLVVVDRNPLSVPATELTDTQVLATFVAGVAVHNRIW